MIDIPPNVALGAAAPRAVGVALAVALASLLAGIAAAIGILVFQLPPRFVLFIPAVPVAAAVFLALLATTERALYLTAFAIGPFGVLQAEVFGVTFSVPELLVLALFARVSVPLLLRREPLTGGVPRKGLAAYLLAAAIGVAVGLARGHGFTHVLQDFRQFIEFLLLYIVVVQKLRTPAQIKCALGCYVAGCALLAAHGLLERFTNIGIPLNQVLSDAVYHGGTRSGSFYGATPLAALLMLSICGGVTLMLTSPRVSTRFSLAIPVALCLTTIVFTNTRASWVALAFALALILLAAPKSPFLIGTVAASLLVFCATLGPLVVSRMEKIAFTKAERSLLERVDYYKTAWYIFRDRPVLGLGWGAAYRRSDVLVNQAYVARPRERVIDERLSVEESTVHSAYLQLVVKVGLAGLAGFLCILIPWFGHMLRAWRARPRDALDALLLAGIVAALVGYLIHSAFENFFQWPVMAQSFWLYMGLSTVMANHVLARAEAGEYLPTRTSALQQARARGEAGEYLPTRTSALQQARVRGEA